MKIVKILVKIRFNALKKIKNILSDRILQFMIKELDHLREQILQTNLDLNKKKLNLRE